MRLSLGGFSRGGAGANLVGERKSQDFEFMLDFDVELCGDLNIESAIEVAVVVV